MTLMDLINTANTILKKKKEKLRRQFSRVLSDVLFFLSHRITELHASDIEIRAVIEIIA